MKVCEYMIRPVEQNVQKRNEPKTLICCCCGVYTVGRQWYNRDAGYGLCPKCAKWIKSRNDEDMQSCYGIEGYHYNIEEVTP